LPQRGMLMFEDLEDRSRLRAHTEELRDGYRETIQRHIQMIREMARRRHIEYVLAPTDSSIYGILSILNDR